jgi:hypothetical protein
MATTVVIPSAADIGAFSPDVADDFVAEKGSYDARLAQKVIDIATAVTTDINALQAGSTITAVNGVTMPAGGALAVGSVLRATAVGTAAYGAVNLADTDAVTGILPGANVALAVAGVSAGAVSAAQATAIDASLPVSKKTVTIGHADLTDADGSQTINIGTALPANSRIVGVDMHTYTPFTGGGAGVVTVDIGTSGDVDALIDGADLFAAAVDGGLATIPKGIRPNKFFAAGGQLTAQVDANVNVADLTAGSVIIDVTYTVLA